MHPILLFPPLLVLCYDARASKPRAAPSPTVFTVTHTVGLILASGALLSVSALLTGSWEFLDATYGVRLLLPDLTPNVGLWWYFFIEMFDSFREFFLGVFWLHVASYMPGLTIRLRKQPLFVATTLTGIFAVFTPYPSIADAALYLSLVPLFRHLFPCECIALTSLLLASLTRRSNAVLVSSISDCYLCILPWSSLLSPLDIRRLRERQLLLRHHACVELGAFHHCGGFLVRSIERRVRRGEARATRERGQAHLSKASCMKSKSLFLSTEHFNCIGLHIGGSTSPNM